MTTFEVSDGGMTITMPNPDKHEFINHMVDLFAQSVEFAELCCALLIEKYGAKLDLIEPGQFYYKHCGQLIENAISGRAIENVEEVVTWAIANVRPEYLGVAEHGSRAGKIRLLQEDFRRICQQYRPPG